MLALFLFSISISAQQKPLNDSLLPPSNFSPIKLPDAASVLVKSKLRQVSDSLIPFSMVPDQRDLLFYDSLAIKASKFLITKKLYDLVVVNGKQTSRNDIEAPSHIGFYSYAGKKIRDISIKRLDVFGTWIDNPLLYNPSNAETFLNRTHLNTNEFIIRNNLLFSVGDTVSPLVLSDNERLLRGLPYIEDSRIIVMPVGENEVDILVITKDLYSLGAGFDYRSTGKGSISLFDKNILGLGHEFRLDVPYNNDLPGSPGLGIEYRINNIRRSFINMDLFYSDGLGEKTYGFSAERRLVSATTRYAGGISIKHMASSEDLDTLSVPEPLRYNLQDYWISRSFLIDRESVSRLILGARYTNNNVFDHPDIMPDSYYKFQKYRLYLGSVTYSVQKHYKTSLLYGYGRTEDIPYGRLLTLTAGKEINEYKERIYAGFYASTGHAIRPLGYLYTSGGVSTFLNGQESEQGMLLLRTTYLSNLLYIGRYRMRNFIIADYTRGFDRFTDEYLVYERANGFSGFSNDSVSGTQRLSLSFESVIFSPRDVLGFRLAFFAFSDFAFLFGTNEFVREGDALSSVGIGLRARNDNLVFKTLQIRLSFYPVLPHYSNVNHFLISGEQSLKPDNFDPGPPGIIPFR